MVPHELPSRAEGFDERYFVRSSEMECSVEVYSEELRRGGA
jgi:hypothetical protein